jgi:hypothetical protein
MVSFLEKLPKKSLFLNSIITIFKKGEVDIDQVAWYNIVTIRIDIF